MCELLDNLEEVVVLNFEKNSVVGIWNVIVSISVLLDHPRPTYIRLMCFPVCTVLIVQALAIARELLVSYEYQHLVILNYSIIKARMHYIDDILSKS